MSVDELVLYLCEDVEIIPWEFIAPSFRHKLLISNCFNSHCETTMIQVIPNILLQINFLLSFFLYFLNT